MCYAGLGCSVMANVEGNLERIIDLNEVFEDCEEEDRGIANDPEVGMTFVFGEEYAQFCHNYAFKKGFMFFTETSKLMDEYKNDCVTRTGVGKYETMYHMMQRLRFKCKMGGINKANGQTS